MYQRIERFILSKIIKFICYFYLKKPDITELVQLKFPTFKSAIFAALNELYYLLGLERGFRLTSLNLEITNTCNLSCQICPVNTKMRRPRGFMDFELFKKIINDNPKLDFILPFQWGEPLLHPQIFDMVRYAKEKGIRSMLTTNGYLLNEELMQKILDSGLERLTFSVDGIPRTHEKIRQRSYQDLKDIIIRFKQLRDERKSHLKIDISMVVFQETEPYVQELVKEWKDIADRVQVIPKMEVSLRKSRCRELWRGTLVVLWDGRVVPCCVDYDARLVVGDAKRQSLTQIFHNEKMRFLRRQQRQGKFSGICLLCNEYSSPKVSPRFK